MQCLSASLRSWDFVSRALGNHGRVLNRKGIGSAWKFRKTPLGLCGVWIKGRDGKPEGQAGSYSENPLGKG